MRYIVVLISMLLAAGFAAADGYLLAVSNEKSNTVTFIDGATGKALGTVAASPRPRGIHASPDGKFIYVALSGTAPEGPPSSRGPRPAASAPPAAQRLAVKKNRGGDGIGQNGPWAKAFRNRAMDCGRSINLPPLCPQSDVPE